MEHIFKEVNKYVISILFLLGGGLFLRKYIQADELESQPVEMLFASIALLVVGVLTMPVVMGRLNQRIYAVLMVLGIVVAAGLAYQNFATVNEEIVFIETKQQVDAETIQRLKDIRDAQEAFKKVKGTFTDDFDTLAAFLNERVMPVTFNMGSFHDTLPESRSRELGYVLKRGEVAATAARLGTTEDALLVDITADRTVYKVRDVLYTSFYEENFSDSARAAKRLPPVVIEELWFNPLTGERFYLETGEIEQGGVKQATILVKDMTPFGREGIKKDTLQFGSLTEAHTDGNWRN
jgi:hypothetical protein